MQIFALNPSKSSLNENLITQLRNFGDVTFKHDIVPLLEVPGILDTNTDKLLLISPLYTNWILTNETLDKIPNLKAVVLTSTSYAWLDVTHLASMGIPVFRAVLIRRMQ